MQRELFPDKADVPVLTVSALTALIKETLGQKFADVCVVGEISEFKAAASGHVYMTLKDEEAVLRAILWRPVARRLKFGLEEGLEVLSWGHVDVYPPRGSYQLIVSEMEPRGMGALQLAFQQLKAELEKEGLFEEEKKKPLPRFPRRIAIVTSPTGAAVRDLINVISRRYPPAEVYLFPVRVQGGQAADEIAHAIDLLNGERPGLDLLIVGRGGGSLEELWAFNEEKTARAIYRSSIPVVSAVGHEVDFTIADFVADRRAATPTEAGEIAVPDSRELTGRLRNLQRRLALALQRAVSAGKNRLHAALSSYALRHPEALIEERTQRTDELLERMKVALTHNIERWRQHLSSAASNLEALSPLRVLERGYSITLDSNDRVLKSARHLEAEQTIFTILRDGQITSVVCETEESPPNSLTERTQS